MARLQRAEKRNRVRLKCTHRVSTPIDYRSDLVSMPILCYQRGDNIVRGLTHKEYVRLKLVAAPHHQRSGLGSIAFAQSGLFFGLRTSSTVRGSFEQGIFFYFSIFHSNAIRFTIRKRTFTRGIDIHTRRRFPTTIRKIREILHRTFPRVDTSITIFIYFPSFHNFRSMVESSFRLRGREFFEDDKKIDPPERRRAKQRKKRDGLVISRHSSRLASSLLPW